MKEQGNKGFNVGYSQVSGFPRRKWSMALLFWGSLKLPRFLFFCVFPFCHVATLYSALPSPAPLMLSFLSGFVIKRHRNRSLLYKYWHIGVSLVPSVMSFIFKSTQWSINRVYLSPKRVQHGLFCSQSPPWSQTLVYRLCQGLCDNWEWLLQRRRIKQTTRGDLIGSRLNLLNDVASKQPGLSS